MTASEHIRLGRAATPESPLRIGILVSGRGSNMEAIIDAAARGEIPVSVEVVVSDRPGAPAIEKARSRGIEAVALSCPPPGPGRDEYHRRLIAALEERDVEAVALAGYMRILPPEVLDAYPYRILNIHPSLLPSFPGLHPHRQALDHGVKVSGCTVHLVDSGVDTGPIILQEAVPVLDGDDEDSLAARILEVEHRLYPKALGLFASGRLVLFGRRVALAEA